MTTIEEVNDLQRRIRELQEGMRATIENAKQCDYTDLAEYIIKTETEDLESLDRTYAGLEQTKDFIRETQHRYDNV